MATVSDMDRAALREQRVETRRRQVRRRRLTALAIVAGVVLVSMLAGKLLAGSDAVSLTPVESAAVANPFHSTLPQEIRGVHVTMDLAGIPGKLASYLALRKDGLNTIELDVKDENGEVGFINGAPAMAVDDGAARPFYDARRTAAQVHRAGVYLIGRVVTFEDPLTAARHPELAIHTAGGGLWHNNGGLGWLNPYSRAAWKYDVDVAVAAAKAGFDEIQFDYVRFPSDGDLSLIRYPGPHTQPMGETIAAFLRYAASRLHPLGVRVSADVFGLSATHDLGVGQYPGQIGEAVDTVYPMTYPSHYGSGEYNLPDPDAAPGATVSDSLRDFRLKLLGTKAQLVPWLQDFSLGQHYTAADVAAQVQAARNYDTGGFLLWNASGIYTKKALAPGPPPPLPPLYAPHL
jgi:hypothetical protein